MVALASVSPVRCLSPPLSFHYLAVRGCLWEAFSYLPMHSRGTAAHQSPLRGLLVLRNHSRGSSMLGMASSTGNVVGAAAAAAADGAGEPPQAPLADRLTTSKLLTSCVIMAGAARIMPWHVIVCSGAAFTLRHYLTG